MKKILLATHNKHKVLEISQLLSPLGFETVSLSDIPDAPATVEDRPTLEENALKKAREAYQSTKLLTLADDTGLEVYYLELQPGVYSARYAGENATYAENNKKLLRAMNGVPERKRNARFRTVVAIVGNGIEKTVDGAVEGSILENLRGTEGFGYDPLFVPNGSSRTYAEMSLDEKNRLSHRAKALEKAIAVLKSL
jgi:XTP/dITP diphosphohydrolase